MIYYTEEDYYNLPEDVRAELIDGKIYYQAAPNRIHQKILMYVSKTIANYIDSKGGPCEVYPAPFAVTLFEDKKIIVEPDISVICSKDKLTERGCLGAPDWIVEIVSPSNPGHDYVRKLNLYLSAGVREYWIIDPATEVVYVYHFQDECFVKTMPYSFCDEIGSGVFQDLQICLKEFSEK